MVHVVLLVPNGLRCTAFQSWSILIALKELARRQIEAFIMGFPLTTSHQLAPIIVPWILLVIATVTVVLRFQARSMQKAKYGVDDWLVLTALVSISRFAT